MKKLPKLRTFTLLELLIVIAIIAVLITLLQPALMKSRQLAKRIVCLSNQRQCHTSLIMYSTDNNTHMITGTTLFLDSYKDSVGPYDWRNNLYGYLSDFGVWKCGNFQNLPEIDDATNTNSRLRSTFSYLPGAPISYRQVSTQTTMQSADDPIIFDLAYQWGGNWRANHSNGGKLREFSSNGRPSFGSYFGGDIQGLNTVFADGSALWRSADKMQIVGPSNVRAGER